MKCGRMSLKGVAIFMTGVMFIFGIANTAFCGEVLSLTTDDPRFQASLTPEEMSDLESRAAQSSDLLNTSSGNDWEFSLAISVIAAFVIGCIVLGIAGSGNR